MSNTPEKSFDIACRYAMQLSLMEVGLGSFLHAFHIPFSGFFLSLNQCFILNRALLHHAPNPLLPMAISNTTAIIKTLSPYGKKFTPMLAISMQGLLFNCGVLLFGNNLPGRCIGSCLLGLWPMIQPALIYGVIYGNIFFKMDPSTTKTIIAAYIFIHLFLSLCVCFLTHLLPAEIVDRYDRYVTSYRTKPASAPRSALRGVLKDFLSPLFLLSLVLSGFFFYATVHSLGAFFLSFFRLIAVAFLTFFLMRKISAEKCAAFFSRLYFFKRYTPYVEEVLQRISKRQ